jgi:hypothetical protein
VTFLLAKAFGKPLVRLPAVVLGRFQHRFLVPRPRARPAGAGRSARPSRGHPVVLGDHRDVDSRHLAEEWGIDRSRPDVVREVYRLLAASKRAEGPPPAGVLDLAPFGVEANRRNLEVARLRLPPATHPPPVHDGRAFDDVTRGLEAT